MLGAAFWGLLGASSLIVGALLAFHVRISSRNSGLILAFGAGVLTSTVASVFTTVDFGGPNVRRRSDHRHAGRIDGALGEREGRARSWVTDSTRLRRVGDLVVRNLRGD